MSRPHAALRVPVPPRAGRGDRRLNRRIRRDCPRKGYRPVTEGLSPNGDCPTKRLLGQTPPGSVPPEVLELREQAVDLVGRVVVDEPGAHRALVQLEALHHLDRVVVAVPDGDVALAEAARRFVWRDAFD